MDSVTILTIPLFNIHIFHQLCSVCIILLVLCVLLLSLLLLFIIKNRCKNGFRDLWYAKCGQISRELETHLHDSNQITK